jgi:hypothetical protein
MDLSVRLAGGLGGVLMVLTDRWSIHGLPANARDQGACTIDKARHSLYNGHMVLQYLQTEGSLSTK